MTDHRQFVDWNRPLLPEAAQRLLAAFAVDSAVDMQQVLCVLPGRRAGRLLLGMLVQQARAARLMLVPPRMVTPGDLPRALLRTEGALATAEESTIAWTRALHQLPEHDLHALIPQLPERGDALAWSDLADRIHQLHETLAGSMLDFAAVAGALERDALLGGDPQRWHALTRIAGMYHRELESCRLRDEQQAWINAIEAGAIDEDKHAVLIGVPELNEQQRRLLRLMHGRTSVLVHAPPVEAAAFDEFGCVVVNAWSRRLIDIDESTLRVENRPGDQAQRVLLELQQLDARFAPHEVTIGLGDESLASILQRRGEWAGVRFHAAEGSPLRLTPPAMLLDAIAAWLADERFATFAALLRHDDVARHVESTARPAGARGVAGWLSLLDRYFNDHLDARFSGQWLGDEAMQRGLRAVHGAVEDLVRPLREPTGGGTGFSEALLAVLRAVYGDVPGADMSPTVRGALEKLRDALVESHRAGVPMPMRLNAASAIRLLLSRLSHERVAEPAGPDELEMLGWLELHVDPAPALLLTGCNEGSIPASVTSDMFLPDGLRLALGMQCDASRYARDAYLLTAIVKSRPYTRIIAGRRSPDGDVLAPSRLLLACDDATLVRRVHRLCRELHEGDEPRPLGLAEPAAKSRFVVPAVPPDLPLPTKMRVTSFRAYLECPYRFALTHMLSLESVRDNAAELNAMQFGALAHEVLCTFGEDASVRDSDDAATIEAYLLDALECAAKRRFGASLLPAVRLQLARLRQRLGAFAATQAVHRRDGWRIAACEWKFDAGTTLDIPGEAPMTVTGTIDRIDLHEARNETLIVDYKTGDSGHSPEKSHRVGRRGEKEWIDLQLPLYEHFARRSGQAIVRGEVKLGYIVLPKHVLGVEFSLASWTRDEIEGAVERARQVVRDIRDRKFEMNRSLRRSFDEFARLCHVNVLQSEMMDDADAGEGDA
jgi:hypothetical protein